MHGALGPRPQLDDCATDSEPDELSVGFAPIAHFIGTSCRSCLGSIAVLPDQQAGGAPYIGIGDYEALRPVPRRLPKPNDLARSLRRAA